MRCWIGLAIFVAVGGCAASDGGRNRDCDVSGSYTVRSQRTSGDCPDLPDDVVIITDDGVSAGACAGGGSFDSDGCEITFSFTCGPNPSTGDTVKQIGSARFSSDGESGQGTLEMTILDPRGGLLCRGIYGLTLTKN